MRLSVWTIAVVAIVCGLHRSGDRYARQDVDGQR